MMIFFVFMTGVVCLTVPVVLILARVYCYIIRKWRRKKYLCFFHPYCNNGGGGERVLWVTILGLLASEGQSFAERRNLQIVIYNGNHQLTNQEILANVQKKFEIKFTEEQSGKIEIVNIALTTLLEAKRYPVATMIGQSIGSILVVLECIFRFVPDYYYDTIGAPFAFPLVRFVTSATIIAYVHYPVISSDMLNRVREQRPSYNNDQRIAQNITISSLKLFYYHIFARGFRFVGNFPHLVMVNSTWTSNHIQSLWRLQQSSANIEAQAEHRIVTKNSNRRLVLVYPPCNTHLLQTIELKRSERFSLANASRLPLYQKIAENKSDQQQFVGKNGSVDFAAIEDQMIMISIGQFRPEKDHFLQIQIMKEIKRSNEKNASPLRVVLLMFGSIRNWEDELYVQRIQENIDSLGLHTMWNEHFGISIVEMMAAGLITIAHNSGGPKEDIIDQEVTGFLADSVDSYVKIVERVYQAYREFEEMQAKARMKSQTFSDELFILRTLNSLERAL